MFKLTAKAHAEVCAPPEEVREGATGGDVTRQPTDVGNSLLTADVSQAALVGVLEGAHLLDAAQALLHLFVGLEDLVAGGLVGGALLLGAQRAQLVLEALGLRHLVEQAGEEGALLRRDLRGRRVVRHRAVPHRPDVLRALHHQVLVHRQPAPAVLLRRDLRHQVAHQRPQGVARRPHEQPVRNLLHLLLAVGTGRLSFDVLVGDVLDHGLGADGDLLLVEGSLRVLDQLLAEHGKDVR